MNKRSITEASFWITAIFGIILKAVYFQYASGISVMPLFSRMNCNMYISLLAAAFISVSVILLLFNKKRLCMLLSADAAVSIVLFADTLYFRYFQNLLTLTVLNQIKLLGAAGGSIKSLLKPGDLIFLADLAILSTGTVFLKRRSEYRILRIRPALRIIAGLLLFSCGIALSHFVYGKSSLGTFSYDNKYVANNLGIYYFHFYDTERYVKENFFEDRRLTESEKTELKEFFSSRGNAGTKYKGAAAGKNLIIIQMEAMQQFLVKSKCNGNEITPNLNRFIRDSVYLSNFYSQTGAGNTSDAEFLTNTSLYPLGDSSVYFRYPGNTYESIGRKLHERDYLSIVFHANYPSFWNRSEMYRSLGFSQFISNRDFTIDEYLGWGLSDKSFFRQALDISDVKGRVYSFMITLTSHHPFNYFNANEGFDTGRLEGTMAGDYIKAANYVDEAVGELLYDLKRRDLYNNSIIVLYGDHCAFPKAQYKSLSDLTGYEFSEYNWVRFQRVPCFIRFPGIRETGVDKTVCGQLDLLPTIANLMGFEAPYAIGHDIFNNQNGHAVLRNSSVITRDFIYAATEDKVYDKKGKTADKSEYEEEIAKYQYELKISDLILRKDALKYLEEDVK